MAAVQEKKTLNLHFEEKMHYISGKPEGEKPVKYKWLKAEYE